jgi:hypothetical protein
MLYLPRAPPVGNSDHRISAHASLCYDTPALPFPPACRGSRFTGDPNHDHHIRLTTSNGNTTESRIVPGLRGSDRLINHGRQLAVSYGVANGSKVVMFAAEGLAGKPVGEGTVVVPPAG